jgi:MtfA peptidase
LRHNPSMLKALVGRWLQGRTVEIPDPLWEGTLAVLPFVARLSAAERATLRGLSARLLATKQMAGAGGLELTAEMQVNIAVQACLPVLNLGLEWYRGWSSIVVYPDEFLVPRAITDEAGVMHEYNEPLSGEAWHGGPLLLSWADAQRATTEGGLPYSVVIHEFAHKIDLLDGDADGIPPLAADLHAGLRSDRWASILTETHHRFIAELELIESELPSGVDPDSPEADSYYARLPLDAYAGDDAAEFFAVSSETFFVEPARLQQAFPDWYGMLAAFFRQDPLR